MKDSVEPSNSRTYQSEQALPARAESEPSVPPSGPCELASLDGIGKEIQVKKGEKLLTVADLREYIHASQQAIVIQSVQSDVEPLTTTSCGPWIYKNKKNTWVHYTVKTNDVEVNNKILLQNLFTRGFPKQADSSKTSRTPVKRRSDETPISRFKKLVIDDEGNSSIEFTSSTKKN